MSEVALSILIPTYNYTCFKLVSDLQIQAENLGVDYEIIVAEDGSRSSVDIIANHKIVELSHCKHLILTNNVGRAAIRNRLAQESSGQYLLFIDADAKVIRSDFLQKYLEAAEHHPVVCGGMICPESCLDPNRQLRWLYEKEHESKVGINSRQFRSFSFLINIDVAHKVCFDERFKLYGYEDVKYGKDLLDAGYQIHLIDNPLQINYFETNKVYLQKTEEALRNAWQFHTELAETVEIVRVAKKLRVFKPIILLIFGIAKKSVKKNLLSSKPNLSLFGFYKLAFYMRLSFRTQN
ncbi:MAG: glycosyltransferase family 2 protein [Bacteroidales bacterium]|nr:glycosyltransferase family 2 protein [Bacteroidales bacterium]